jgi:hypothetical protein
MRRRSARRKARAIASNVVAFHPPPRPIDVYTDIANTRAARERLDALLTLLARQRKDAFNAFLQAFAASLAALKYAADRTFVDAQIAKFTIWKHADDELAKRIDAMNVIRAGLEDRIREFEKTYRNETAELLSGQIDSLKQQTQDSKSDRDPVDERVAVLQSELDRVHESPKKSSAARKRKK